MKRNILFSLVASAFAFNTNINAQVSSTSLRNDTLQLNTITTAVPFLLITPDSRSGGMGDAGTAISADAFATHWNAAKLVYAPKKVGFGFGYTPWLRQLVPDINMLYLSGYTQLDKMSAFGGSLRYFTLGNITFTDQTGNTIGQFKPNEFAINFVYSRKLSDNFSGGVSAKYINSNLTNGITANGTATKAGQAFAVDLSGYYNNDDVKIFDRDGSFAFGVVISNIGNKISYTDNVEKDFLPMNLRIGQATTIKFDDYNKLTFALDLNKLLVPTPPIYARDSSGSRIPDGSGGYVIEKGKNPNTSVPNAIIQSFYDAPVGFKEELREINLSPGLEYWYNDLLAFRTGYFYEHYTKGNRQYLTFGLGVRFMALGIDASYLISTTQRNPLANTLRISLTLNMDSFSSDNTSNQ